jgi:hypothetical protein
MSALVKYPAAGRSLRHAGQAACSTSAQILRGLLIEMIGGIFGYSAGISPESGNYIVAAQHPASRWDAALIIMLILPRS